MTVVFHKASVVPRESEKCSHFRQIPRVYHVMQALDLGGGRTDARFRHFVTQIFYLTTEKLAFLSFELEVRLPEPLEH